MKKVRKKMKQILSILLSVIMVITMIPQNTLNVSATEPDTIEGTTEEIDAEVQEEETDGMYDSGINASVNDVSGNDVIEDAMEDDSEDNTKDGSEEDTDYTFTETLSYEYYIVEQTDMAGITYTNDCVTENRITEGIDLTFTVYPMEDGLEIDKVEVKIGSAEAMELTAVDGVYTVLADTISGSDTGEITIIVTTKNRSVNVSFDVTGATIKNVSDTENPIEITETLTINAYEFFLFTVEAHENYRLDKVTMQRPGVEIDEELAPNESGVYTITPGENVTVIVHTTYLGNTSAENYKVTFVYDESKLAVSGNEAAEAGVDYSFNVQAMEGYLLYNVEAFETDTYGTESQKSLTVGLPMEGNTYTISADEITTGITIVLTACEQAPMEYTIVEQTDMAMIFYTNDCVNIDRRITEGTDLTFTVQATPPGMEVDQVKVKIGLNEAIELTAVDGVYTVSAEDIRGTITGEITIIVTIKNSSVNVSFDVTGATVTNVSDAENPKVITEPFTINAYEFLLFTVEAHKNYRLDKVTMRRPGVEIDEELIPNENGVYTVTPGENVTIIVHTTYLGNKSVVFANRAKNMTYSVATNEYVKLATGKLHTYTLEENAPNIDFTVYATGSYEPVVTLSDGSILEAEKGVTKDGKTPYTYSIAEELLVHEEIITIKETIENKEVKVVYDATEVSIVSASIDGRKISAEELNEAGAFYGVPYGSSVTIIVEANDNCRITKAVTNTGSANGKNEKIKANGFTFTVKAMEDSETVITSEKLYTVNLEEDGSLINAVSNVYSTAYGKEYSISVLHGSSEYTSISNVEIKNGNNPAKSTAEIVEENVAILQLSKEDAGKKLKVNITVGEGEDSKIVTATLKVLPLVSKVTVAGVKNGKLSQTADTVKEYKLTLNPANAANTIYAEVTAIGDAPTEEDITAAKAAVQAEVRDGKLVITTFAAGARANAAVVKLYNRTTSTEEEKDYVTGGTFTVSVTEPAMVKVKPTIALKSADDVSLTLTLGAKKVAAPNNGKVYYKVEITPQSVEGVETPQRILEATANPFYVEKTGNLQNETFIVNNSGAGNGQAWKFNVKVTLVQTKDSTEITKENEENITVFKTATGKEGKKNGLATKKPYYETNLKLQKGTTAVYTTQKHVVIATAKFGKNTTFTKITAKDTRGTAEEGGLNVKVEGSKILVSANTGNFMEGVPYTALGKHTIEVTAEAPDTMVAAKATITVNVVQGIETISVDSANALYKGEKKAATMSFGLNYNEGQVQPKLKKVVWSVVDGTGRAFDEEDALYGMITVKNGKVTVNKKYVLSENEAENQFIVKVKAADFAGNTVCGYSNRITITSEREPLGEVVLVALNWNSGFLEVVARSGDTITADKLAMDGYGEVQAVILKKGAVEKDRYSMDDIFQACKVSFSINNKAVKLSKDGYISGVTKSVKNVKITATAQDGSKRKVSLDKLNIDYVPVEEELGVMLQQLEYNSEFGNWQYYQLADIDAKSMKFYDGTANARFDVCVLEKNGEEWQPLTGLTNYKLDVSGAKVVYKNALEGIYSIVVNGEKATITLKDKSKTGAEAVKTYTLENKALSKKKALKLKASGNLIAGSYESAQTITYTLPTTYNYEGKYVMVTTDMVNREKNDSNYECFEQNTKSLNGCVPIDEDGVVELYFNRLTEEPGKTDIPAGNYKLWFSFGEMDEKGNFIADAKPTAVTLKAVTPKKATFKLNNSYTISAEGDGSVKLTGTGRGINPENLSCSELKNANINGSENAFLDYFELDGTVLKLKHTVTEEQLAYLTGKNAKNDLNGYVSYSIWSATGTLSGTAKITVKVEEGVVIEKKEDTYFIKTTDDTTMTCEITGLSEEGKTWVINEVTVGDLYSEDGVKSSGELIIPKELVVNGKSYTVTSIGDEAFQMNNNILAVKMADSITKIGNYAFYCCKKMKDIELSEYLMSIGSSAFEYCSSLTDVMIPKETLI